jgi:hypothetical protein
MTTLQLSRLTLLLIATSLVLISCKPKPIDNPESLDPIYSDLIAQSAAATAKAESQKKKIAELEETISGLDNRDPALKRTIVEKQNLERGLIQIEQDAKYFEIRANQRRQYDKEAYLKAFREQQPWPDPSEFEEYQTQKKLRHTSRDWSERVPKLQGYDKPGTGGGSETAKKPESASKPAEH